MEGCIDLNELSAALLRQLLTEAEARERAAFERERANNVDPAVDLPAHLRSVARELPAVLTARQAREVLNVTNKGLRAWIKSGKLPATQHGPHGRVFITRDAVLLLLGSENGR